MEVSIAAGLFFMLLAGALALYSAQNRLGWISRGQYDLQASAQKLLEEMVEGERRTWAGATVRGLRYASAVAVSEQGLCFRTANHVVTYYLEGTTIFRRVEAAYPEPLQVVAEGGSPVLQQVTRFEAVSEEHPITLGDGSQSRALTVSIRLDVRKDVEQDISLRTNVRLRNWFPPGS
jgi:hypothetical protein